MNDSVDARDFGRLEAEVGQLKELLTEMRNDQKLMKEDWDKAKGGTKVMFAIATILGGVFVSVINWFIGKF